MEDECPKQIADGLDVFKEIDAFFAFLKKRLAEKDKIIKSLKEENTKLKRIIADQFKERVEDANELKSTIAQIVGQKFVDETSIEESLVPTDNFEILEFEPNAKDQTIAVPASEQDQMNASNQIAVHKPKKIMPRMRISGIPADTEDLVAELKQSNPAINNLLLENPNESLRLVVVLNNRKNLHNSAVIQVSTGIRDIIAQSWKLKLGMGSYPVFNHVHIRQCGKCQKFGHAAKGPKPCKVSKPSCGMCAEDHFTSECPGYNDDGSNKIAQLVQKKCANCKSLDHGAIEKRSCLMYVKKRINVMKRMP